MQASNLHLQQVSKLLQNLKDTLQDAREQFADFWSATVDEARKYGV